MTASGSNDASGNSATGLVVRREGATFAITLDRASKLNAINIAMRRELADALPRIARNPDIYGIVLKAAPGKMFSAGGDIRELCEQMQAGPAEACRALAHEYALTWLLDCFSKPSVALIDAPALGSGAGFALRCTHRVAGEGYRFQMPETALGFFPDDGVCHAFARMPHSIGIYLGLTGAAVGRADAWLLGLATHCIPAGRFARVEALFSEAEPIDPVLDGLHEDPGPAPLMDKAELIARCFSAPTVLEIMARLAAERGDRAWCDEAIATLAKRSPLALEVTLRHISEAADLDLRQTLMVDHRLGCRLLAAPDFKEAVRTLIIEKQGAPRWQPGRLEDVSKAMVDRLFAPLSAAAAEGALFLPTRQEMQASRV